MQSQRYQQLNPLALAVAAGSTELITALIISFPTIGMMRMMSGYGHMMWGVGITWWLGGAVISALAGAIFAWIYNAVNAPSIAVGARGSGTPMV
jgi:hypothetical protein